MVPTVLYELLKDLSQSPKSKDKRRLLCSNVILTDPKSEMIVVGVDKDSRILYI
jgi:hypothetical protein